MPFWGKLFASFVGIAQIKLCANFEVSSFTGSGDIFEGMPDFLRVT